MVVSKGEDVLPSPVDLALQTAPALPSTPEATTPAVTAKPSFRNSRRVLSFIALLLSGSIAGPVDCKPT